MNRYRVFNGIAHVGPGQLLHLSGEQIKARAHNLELPDGYQLRAKDPSKEKPPEAKPADVKAMTALQFKVGEIIGLPELPSNLIGVVEPVDPPKSSNDEKAADVALLKKNPKAHAEKTKAKRRKSAEAKAAAKK